MISAAKCDGLPVAKEPYWTWPGRDRARFTTSRAVFTGNEGCTYMISGTHPTRVTGARSRSGLYGSFG